MDFFFEQFRFRKKTDVNVIQLFWLFYIDLFFIFLLKLILLTVFVLDLATITNLRMGL
jgi:hypothetical protein